MSHSERFRVESTGEMTILFEVWEFQDAAYDTRVHTEQGASEAGLDGCCGQLSAS